MSEYIIDSLTNTYGTKSRLEFIKITSDLKKFVENSRVKNGTVTIQTHHTTFSVWVNEDEKNLIGGSREFEDSDLKRILDRFAGPNEKYGHNDIKDSRNPNGKRDTHLCRPNSNGTCHECINGHAHAQAMILPTSITLIVKNGELLLGVWQEVMLIELDHDRERRATFLVQGISKES